MKCWQKFPFSSYHSIHPTCFRILTGMTKHDLCSSEEWPRHFIAEWEKISQSRRKLRLWWQNIEWKGKHSALHQIMHLKLNRNVTLSFSFGKCPPWWNLDELILRYYASFSKAGENPISLDRWDQRWIHATSMASQSPFVELIWKPGGKMISLLLKLRIIWINRSLEKEVSHFYNT